MELYDEVVSVEFRDAADLIFEDMEGLLDLACVRFSFNCSRVFCGRHDHSHKQLLGECLRQMSFQQLVAEVVSAPSRETIHVE